MSCAKRALALVAFAICSSNAKAQDIEPRAFSNAPVGMNFLIAGYGYTEGNVLFDPSVPLTDAYLRTNSPIFAYARALDAWGDSAKFDMIVPHVTLAGNALYQGQPVSRNVSGFADPRFRFSVNFFGAPALSLQEFAGYRQDLIVGASFQVSAPWGQYDATKIVNIGNNRWSFKPELGISKAWGSWTWELIPSITYYSDNNDFQNGGTFAQAPIYAVQGHAIRSFVSGIWVALDAVYFTGGRTTTNGVADDNVLRNSRMGLTIALPIDRKNSVKLSAISGTSTRTGSDIKAIGVAWQYRWGAGF
jgi:hypothetical protein